MPTDIFQLGDSLRLIPVVNSDPAFARGLTAWLADHPFDRLLVPLPPEFRTPVLDAATRLPAIHAVVAPPLTDWSAASQWSPGSPDEDNEEDLPTERPAFYVPIDPAQAVIAAIVAAAGERTPIEFYDALDPQFSPLISLTADAYAIGKVSLEVYAAAMLPAIPRPVANSHRRRIISLARNLFAAQTRCQRGVALCPLAAWPWIREEFMRLAGGGEMESLGDTESEPDHEGEEQYAAPEIRRVDEATLMFCMADLPASTGYVQSQRARSAERVEEFDTIKHLLITARKTYTADLRDRARKISPLMLNQCIRYIRNLTLLDRRLSPQMYTIVLAAKQVVGDQYAIHVLEAAKEYPFEADWETPAVRFGIDRLQIDEDIYRSVNLLDSPQLSWRSIELHPRPKVEDQKKWAMRWNPYSHCSWPPEDHAIESFRTHVVERAAEMLASDQAISEKFSTSFMDGIDIRETLRHWYDGGIYVKRQPPARGKLDACVMLFDVPADPRRYVSRVTWFAEHHDESTLAFFATNLQEEMVGPGVAVATYGGAMFLFPPRPVPDIWRDPRLDRWDTLEERLIAGTCLHAQSRHIVLLSPMPPTATWRRIAKIYRKRLVHMPLGKFSDSTIQQLRMFHILNGKQVRSYAAQFIRKV